MKPYIPHFLPLIMLAIVPFAVEAGTTHHWAEAWAFVCGGFCGYCIYYGVQIRPTHKIQSNES